MAAKRPLRVATEADAKPARPMTLSEAIESGTYVEILRAQRRQMVADVGEVTGPALAALHRQIALHSKEIAAIDANDEDQEASESAEVQDGDFDASAV
jgi:precorrin-6B methylase 2